MTRAASTLAGVLALSMLATSARAQSDVFPEAPRIDHLPNGLTVISVRTDSPGIIAYYTLVRVGSRDEVEDGHSGYAHLFEHMMFRGTENYPQDRYEETIQSFGADNNAYTTNDFTLYTVTAPSSVLDRVVELEADRFQRLSYTEEVYRTETGAVQGEYNTQASSPFLAMWEALSEIGFSRHTYRHTTLGYLRDIQAMPEEYAYSRQFFLRYYTPDNCTVIVAGDINHAALMTEVRRRYAGWRGRRHQAVVPVEPEPQAANERHIDWPSPAAPRMFVGWRTPAFAGSNARERAAALRTSAALRVVHGLAFSEPSPLYQRLVVDERRLLSLGSWADEPARDPHFFVATAEARDGENLAPILAEVQAEIDRIGRGETEVARIDAVKSHVRYALIAELDTPTAVADLVARYLAVSGELSSIDAYLRALAAVTPEDVARVAREYLNSGRRSVVTLTHGASPTGGAP